MSVRHNGGMGSWKTRADKYVSTASQSHSAVALQWLICATVGVGDTVLFSHAVIFLSLRCDVLGFYAHESILALNLATDRLVWTLGTTGRVNVSIFASPYTG